MKKCSVDFNPQVCRFCDGFPACLLAETERLAREDEREGGDPTAEPLPHERRPVRHDG
jgi:hypothetical protein